MPSVLQDWVMNLPRMQQGVLLSAVRAHDGLPKEHPLKVLLRWYRRCILISAYAPEGPLLDPYTDDHGGSFTGPWPRDATFREVAAAVIRSVDETNIHYLMHLIHAIEILGYQHPDVDICAEWRRLYESFVDDFHLYPESEARMNRRLCDDPHER